MIQRQMEIEIERMTEWKQYIITQTQIQRVVDGERERERETQRRQ